MAALSHRERRGSRYAGWVDYRPGATGDHHGPPIKQNEIYLVDDNREISMYRKRTMLKVLSMSFGLSLASTLSMASDATWFCSAIIGTGVKPWTFKYVVKGRELIDFEVEINRLITGRPSDKSTEVEPLTIKYTILEDTNIRLVAVHTDEKNDPNNVTVRVILINKASSELTLVDIGPKQTSTYKGTCQVGK
jgi:hypothetical protein